MTSLNYKWIARKVPKEIVRFLESEYPDLLSEPHKHYVFKFDTLNYADKNTIIVKDLKKWVGHLNIGTTDSKNCFISRVVWSHNIEVAPEVKLDAVMEELKKSFSAALSSSKTSKNVCFTFEYLNSHLDYHDFIKKFAKVILMDESLGIPPFKITWMQRAKILNIYC